MTRRERRREANRQARREAHENWCEYKLSQWGAGDQPALARYFGRSAAAWKRKLRRLQRGKR